MLDHHNFKTREGLRELFKEVNKYYYRENESFD